jgi:hypothetical protein
VSPRLLPLLGQAVRLDTPVSWSRSSASLRRRARPPLPKQPDPFQLAVRLLPGPRQRLDAELQRPFDGSDVVTLLSAWSPSPLMRAASRWPRQPSSFPLRAGRSRSS